jgi:SAM-dependent methyltransferase
MNYPFTRHIQRYEYVRESGYIRQCIVADIGCGTCYGSFLMTASALFVYGVDSNLSMQKLYAFNGDVNYDRFLPYKCDVLDFNKPVDVCTAIEVFEHVEDPYRFISHLSSICKWAFITTPLVGKTGVTPNNDHVAEYSSKDFDKIVSGGFSIMDKVYQKSDLSIVKKAEPCGYSCVPEHVVQMIWGRSKNG